MSVSHIEVLVEEPSMEALLQILLPRILGTISFHIHPFQCKTELLKHLPIRLRGYGHWLPEDWRILVIVDRDNDDCNELKHILEETALDEGFITRSSRHGPRYSVVNRLAIEELEAWYFGDWMAVRAAYPRVKGTIPDKSAYRDPDAIRGGTWESFEQILRQAGYFKTGLRKIEAARSIAPHMSIPQNTSRSFQIFHEAIVEMANE
jgi:hypothetical protein